MTFIQKYQIFEQNFGMQEIRFVVSDTFTELSASDSEFAEGDGLEVDIFQLESLKNAFEGDGMSFAVDEMGFSINEGICQTDDEIAALYFTLQASDVDVHRYCALYMNFDDTDDDSLLASRMFIGEITTDISGEDLVIFGSEYSSSKKPVREYKFKVASFDIAMFDRLTFHESIKKDDGEFIVDGSGNPLSINDLSSGGYTTDFKLRETTRATTGSDFDEKYYQNFDTLHNALQYILGKCETGVNEILGTTFTLTLPTCTTPGIGAQNNTGITTMYAIPNWVIADSRYETFYTLDKLSKTNPFTIVASAKKLYIETDNVTTYGGSPIYVNEKFATTIRVEGDDNAYGFRQYDNLSDLLMGIARGLGCFVFVTFTGLNAVEITFKSKWLAVESGKCYIRDMSRGSIDVSSVINDKENKWYGNNNAYAIDGFDEMPHPFTESSKYQAREKEIEAERERDIDSAKLLFTTSQTALNIESGIEGQARYFTVPLGIVQTSLASPDLNRTPTVGKDGEYWWSPDHLQTALFVLNTTGGSSTIHPAARVLVNYGGETRVYDTLTEYINDVSALAEQYYESEYSITVPYWNGFSSNETGTSYGWDKVKLGSQIDIEEELYIHTETGWEATAVTNTYIVQEIERSLTTPETKLKMIKQGDESFAVYTSKPGDTPFSNEDLGEISDIILDAKLYIASETINTGDVVQLKSDGTIKVAVPDSAWYGTTLGVALDDGELNDMVPVQTDGIAYDDGYSLNVGSPVFYVSGVTQDISSISSSGNDMIILMGIADTERSFVMRIREVVVE